MSLHLNNESDRCECHDCVHIRVGLGPASIGYTPKPDAFQKPPTKEEVKRDYHNCDCEFCGHPDTIHVPAKPQPSTEKCDCLFGCGKCHRNIKPKDAGLANAWKPKDVVEECPYGHPDKNWACGPECKQKDIVNKKIVWMSKRFIEFPVGSANLIEELRDLVRLVKESK